MSFKVMVHAFGDPADHYVSNALRFTAADEAELYAEDLSMRWTQVEDWRVEQSDDAPTVRLDADGKRVYL